MLDKERKAALLAAPKTISAGKKVLFIPNKIIYAFRMHKHLLENKLGALLVEVSDGLNQTDIYSSSATAALLTLLHWAELPVTELAEVLRLSQPATSRLLHKLEAEGLVDRPIVSGRMAPMRLSRRGRTAAQKIQTERVQRMSELMSPLNKKDRTELDRLLSLLLSNAVVGRKHARQICRFCDHEICDGPDCPVGTAATVVEQGENII